MKSVVLNISNCNRNVAIPVKMRGLTMSGDMPLPKYGTLGVLSQFSPVKPVFSYHWLFLGVIMKSVMFNISNCNIKLTILVKMRGLTMFGVMPLPRYGISRHFQPF